MPDLNPLDPQTAMFGGKVRPRHYFQNPVNPGSAGPFTAEEAEVSETAGHSRFLSFLIPAVCLVAIALMMVSAALSLIAAHTRP